ncbi:MAG: Flp pilus assembly complex ATPase component TadA [Planctomycetes bacterium]|nr:Flp pilus assembly complex ATPase component TadA [Planctomycetota bacterium]
MNEHPEGAAAQGTATSVPAKPRALAVVGKASAEQVVFAEHFGSVSVTLRSVKNNEFEVVGSTFFPKNTHLEFALQGPASAFGLEGSSVPILRGVVRRVQMVASAPTYRVWVRMEEIDPAIYRALWLQCRTGSEAAAEGGQSYPIDSSSETDWTARLLADGVITEAQLEEALATASTKARPLDAVLVEAGFVREEQIASCIAMTLSVPFVDPLVFDISKSNRDLIPLELTRTRHLYPLFALNGVLTLGMADTTDLAVIDQVRLRTKCEVDPCHITKTAIEALINRASREAGVEENTGRQGLASASRADPEDDNDSSTNTTVRMVRSLVEKSARDGISDIHIEPGSEMAHVRVRVDGMLHEESSHSPEQHALIVSRIKVMAKLDITETRRPQDGHLSMETATGRVDVRVSTIPTVCGENVVLRLLISDGSVTKLASLGMPAETLAKMEEFLENPHGMILVTGPTGSGKTTTLYAALERLSTSVRNVVTLEDPVEKRIAALRQTEVNPKAGVTFATGLRSILRQDPDIIMVGEIRDREAAELAVQAALTGHLVLSTLHTNNAVGAIVRLSEIGIPPFLITSSLQAVVSQRLVRRVCKVCAKEIKPDARLIKGLEFGSTKGVRFMAGAGCGHCLHSGYKGRVGLYEMLQLTSGLNAALLEKASRSTIEREAAKALTSDIRSEGLRKVREGLTTLEEIARVDGLQKISLIGADEED